MSKSSLYLIVAIAVALTAATFFVAKHDPKRVCFFSDTTFSPTVIDGAAHNTATDSAGQQATARGYPFSYYEQPFPADCLSQDDSKVTTFNTAHLAYDFLICLGVAALLFVPSALYRWWRGPAMLGDNVRRP